MLKRSVSAAARKAGADTLAAAPAAGQQPPSNPLLPYALRRAAACEMLYGGSRVQYLVQPPFTLHKIRSENLPPPSLYAERHDLGLEMQLPRDMHVYNSINMAIQRQVGGDSSTLDGEQQQLQGGHADGFDMGAFFTEQHHPERHHNSSLPYAKHDTNNVLAMRLFPVNVGVRARTEAIRIRTDDCLQRLRDADLCAKMRLPLEHPLPLSRRSQYAAIHRVRQERCYDAPTEAAGERAAAAAEEASRTAHLRGAAAHPPPSELSIVTRPVDRLGSHSGSSAAACTADADHLSFPVHPFAAAAVSSGCHSARSGSAARLASQRWLPLQTLKPMGHNWSAATRSSGVRGPHMQLMQERLDQKGFGWKRKSRSLWQQDVATAGFRPHRYF
ncbi:mitoribosomal_protein_mL82 [Leishmania major strain Friedlin]|nr:mitoribosomal_protein_mL82 [Leishmania major strain Friedlin]